MVVAMCEKIINKIHRISLKKKIIFFFALFVLSFAWVLFRNPVYIDTTAYVFPIEDIGDGRVYWGIKNGYNTLMAEKIPEDAYYHKLKVNSNSVITIENKDSSFVERIDLKNGINFHHVRGGVVQYENFEGFVEILELPKKENIQLLTIQNGPNAELYFSSIQVWYKKQLLNRDVAATFPFYLAYTTPQNIAFDKAVSDNNLYDVSFERQKWQGQADFYLDPVLSHFIAQNFKRSIDFPFGHSQLLVRMAILASFALTCFLFFIPYFLLKTFQAKETNKLLFIILGIYLIVMWLVFRHSLYRTWDGMLLNVINLNYDITFTHIFMINEYIFYLIGYSSRTLFVLLQLCLIIFSYERILSKYLISNPAKVIKYLLIFIVLFSPFIILVTVSARRDSSWLLWIIMAYMYLIQSKYYENKKLFIVSVICLLIGIAHRMDCVIFAIPYLFFLWYKKKTLKNTIFVGALTIIVNIYAIFIGAGSHTVICKEQ